MEVDGMWRVGKGEGESAASSPYGWPRRRALFGRVELEGPHA